MILRLGNTEVDLDQMTVRRDDATVPLTNTEARLLRYLAARQAPVHHEDLLRNVWQYSARSLSNTVRTTMRRLRAKIEVDPSRPEHLLTEWGHGYRLVFDRTARPATRSPLVGRAQELRALCGLATAPLVTVVGPGGVGKTRLAVEVADTFRARGRRVAFCDLSPCTSLSALVERVCDALGVKPEDADPAGTVERVLRGRGDVLLVLDNFEQLVASAPDSVGRWMGAASGTTVLVTSQVPLGLDGERVFTLPPLAPHEAVALFVLRAQAVSPGFAPQGADADATREVVDRVDHLPLAIELAAGWIDLVSPARLRDRLDDVILATPGPSGRHPSLQGALDHSWSLLPPPARAVLSQLAVFHGGFDDAALHAVVRTEADLAPILNALRDRSWVRDGALTHLVRSYLVERAAPDRDVRDRHFAWVADPRRAEDLVATHLGDVVAAVEHGLAANPAAGRRLLLAVERALARRRSPQRLPLLELAQRTDPPPAEAVALQTARVNALHQTNAFQAARTEAEALVVDARALGDDALLAGALLAWSDALHHAGVSGVVDALEESRACARAAGADYTACLAARSLSIRLRFQGRFDDALAAAEQGVAIAQRRGWAREQAKLLYAIGGLRTWQDRYAEAVEALEQAQALDPHPVAQAYGLQYLGTVHARAGASEKALDELLEAAETFREHGVVNELASTLYQAANVRFGEADHAASLELLGAAADALGTEDRPRQRAGLAQGFAWVHLDAGDLDAARSHAEHALAVFESLQEARHLAVVASLVGTVAHAQGHLDAAELRYRHALAIWEREGVQSAAVYTRGWLVALLAERGHDAEARAVAPTDDEVAQIGNTDEQEAVRRLCTAASGPAAVRDLLRTAGPAPGPETRIATRLLARLAAVGS